jgi:Tol biopolymer transport system component
MPWHAYFVKAGLVCCLASGAIGVSGAAVRQEQQPGLLAFETPSGIHVIHTDGTGLRRLPGTRPGDQNPDWSPDGRRLVFWTDERSPGEIYVADADGSGRRLLSRTETKPSDQFPAWSPDGRLIAFESRRSGDWHIWVMRPDGSGVRRLTPPGRGGYSPQWAPDGKRIVYTALWPRSSLAIVDLAGDTRALKTLSIDEDWAPSWSPDGSSIAFASTAQHEKGELYVVDTHGGTPRRLTQNTAADQDPVWSPDSQLIVFDSGRAGLDEVFVMNADGTDQRRITRIPTEYACCSAWRPEQ